MKKVEIFKNKKDAEESNLNFWRSLTPEESLNKSSDGCRTATSVIDI